MFINLAVGGFGYMFCLKPVDEAHIAYHLSDLVLPSSLASLPDFKETLDSLYAFKRHQIKLKKIIEPAFHRQKASSVLMHYRSGHENDQSIIPTTLFTPVRKQKDYQKITAVKAISDDEDM